MEKRFTYRGVCGSQVTLWIWAQSASIVCTHCSSTGPDNWHHQWLTEISHWIHAISTTHYCAKIAKWRELAQILNNNSAYYVSRQHDTDCISCWTPAVQQSIDISCLPGPQQQTCRSGVQRPNDGKDGRTDIQTDAWHIHKPCCMSCVNNWHQQHTRAIMHATDSFRQLPADYPQRQATYYKRH